MDWFQYIPLLIKYGPDVKAILDEALSNDDIATKIRKTLPTLAPLLEQWGAKLFPKAAAQIHVVGAAVAAYDQNIVKWVQGSLNKLLSPSPMLTVDGIYGPMTRSAVEKVQAQLGLKIDGLAGQITQAAIGTALTKLA